MKRKLIYHIMFWRYLPGQIIKGKMYFKSEKKTTNKNVNTFKFTEFIKFDLCQEKFGFILT